MGSPIQTLKAMKESKLGCPGLYVLQQIDTYCYQVIFFYLFRMGSMLKALVIFSLEVADQVQRVTRNKDIYV